MTQTEPLDQNAANALAVILHASQQDGTTTDSGPTAGQSYASGQGLLSKLSNNASPPAAPTPDATAIPTGSSDGTIDDPVPQGTPVNQGYGVNGHPGIDLGVPLDTSLVAAQSGTVDHVANDDPGGYGLWVEIQTPDGFHIRYGHLHSATVQVGQQVKAGQVIGRSGGEAGGPTSGNSTGAHLHFEVRGPDGNTVDPTPWLAGGHAVVDANPSQVTATMVAPAPYRESSTAGNLLDVAAGESPTHDTQNQKPVNQPADQAQGQATNTGNFANDVLAGIGAPVTPENVRAIQAWARAEGGTSHNNPLNTTQGAPGATDFNSVGVKTYTSYEQGVQATIQTLLNGNYANIIAALKAGNNAMSVANAIAASPWGTGALVKQILGGG